MVGVLGKGSFGQVLDAVDVRTGARVAIKEEVVDGPCPPQLAIEARVLRLLQRDAGIPHLHAWFTEAGRNYLVMQKLGASLEGLLRQQPEGRLPLPYCQRVALQALARLQSLHAYNVVHRDVKPDNFLLGPPGDSQLYLVDFGLCKALVDPDTGEHVPERLVEVTVGTPRYTSCRAHDRWQQTRRDDLESFAYMMVYLAKGVLPWQSSQGVALEDVPAMKRDTAAGALCAGLPPAYAATLELARGLAFEECPPYARLRRLWDEGGLKPAGRTAGAASRARAGPPARPTK